MADARKAKVNCFKGVDAPMRRGAVRSSATEYCESRPSRFDASCTLLRLGGRHGENVATQSRCCSDSQLRTCTRYALE